MSGYIRGVPVCASYCNRWFEACKSDLTCVEDWLADFDFAKDGANTCPANSTCVTFQQMYGDARGLCNKMWGAAFRYSENEDNCTVMKFSGSNPNYRLSFPAEGSGCSAVRLIPILVFSVVIFTFLFMYDISQ